MSDKLDAILKEIMENKARYKQAADEVNSDPDLTPEAKRRRVFELWQKADQKHRELTARLHETREAERRALRQRVFSLGGSTLSPAEQATISASYRAALAEAEKAKDSDELARLMSRYHDAGDRIGVLAAGQIAVERNARGAMNLFRELQPLRAAALGDLAEFEARWGHHRDATGRFNEKIATSPIPRPAGTGNMGISA